MEEQHSVGKTVFLHLFPGALAVGIFAVASTLLSEYNFPPLLILSFALLLGVIPFELGVVMFLSKKTAGRFFAPTVIPYTARLKWKEYIIPVAVSFFWPVVVFTTFGPWLNDFLKTVTFPWLPNWFDLGVYIRNPELYPRNVRILTWLLSLVLGSLIGPAVEELYFHGYLLPRLSRFRQVAPVISTVLFVAYHFWSPHMVLTRIIAILPLTYFIWKKKNFYIGIIAHCLLNLIGDVLVSIPAVFG